MTKAVYSGVIVAESDDVKTVQGIPYFPRASVDTEVLVESPTTSRCPWKGKANYYHVDHGNDTALDAAFEYKNPWPLARRLVSDRIGFWRGVDLVD